MAKIPFNISPIQNIKKNSFLLMSEVFVHRFSFRLSVRNIVNKQMVQIFILMNNEETGIESF